MPEYDNELSGALFKNQRKSKDSQPDYRGQATIDGADYWLAAWIKKSKKGDTYMSLAFTAKDEETDSAPADEPDDDIPF